jgi:hypothetical protein
MRRINSVALLLSALLMLSGAGRAMAQTAYEHFESPLVHPVRLTPDGTKLLVTNTADSRLSVFSLSSPRSPTRVAEIPVGLEPVSVNARTDDEVWVVNSVSDSISIVSLSQDLVVDTLAVGDEPADVVFAGSPQRAFVTVARRNEVRVYGTDRVARIDANGNVVARVEVGPSTGATVNPRTKRGPRGLALHGASGTNTLSVVNAATASVVGEVAVGAYSCHIDAELDMIAWDLGDPGGSMQTVVDRFHRLHQHGALGTQPQPQAGRHAAPQLRWREPAGRAEHLPQWAVPHGGDVQRLPHPHHRRYQPHHHPRGLVATTRSPRCTRWMPWEPPA